MGISWDFGGKETRLIGLERGVRLTWLGCLWYWKHLSLRALYMQLALICLTNKDKKIKNKKYCPNDINITRMSSLVSIRSRAEVARV